MDIELDVVGYFALSKTNCGYIGRLLRKLVDLLLEMWNATYHLVQCFQRPKMFIMATPPPFPQTQIYISHSFTSETNFNYLESEYSKGSSIKYITVNLANLPPPLVTPSSRRPGPPPLVTLDDNFARF